MDTLKMHRPARDGRRLIPLLVVPMTGLFLRCTPFGSAEEPSPTQGGDAEVSSDGNPGDAGGADAGGHAGTANLLPNPGFEDSLSDCGGWAAGVGTAVRSAEARTGSWSCLICPARPDTPEFYLAAPAVNVQAGSTYVAEAWLKIAPGESADNLVGVTVAVPEDGGLRKLFGNQLKLTNTWTRSSTTVSVQANGAADFQVFVFVPDGGCVLVDDTSLHPQL